MYAKFDSTTKELCLFALPMLLGNILQSCYNMVDMAVVGQFVGRDGLAAVRNTSMICFVSNSLCIGFTVGGNVLVARCRGAGSLAGQREIIQTLFTLSAVGGVLLTGLNYALYPLMLGLMNIPAEAHPYAVEYMDIICAGNFFVFGYNALCAVMRGLGDSRRPLHFIAVAAGINIILDYLLVGGLHWGVRGAAMATVLSQAVSCGVALVSLLRRSEANYGLAHLFSLRAMLHVSAGKCGLLLRQGLPVAFHYSVLNISYIIVTALFNEYGTAAAAAAGIGLKINTFVAMPCWAIGQAVTTFAGHSMGAANPNAAAKAARNGIKTALLFTGALLALIHLFIRPFLGFFSPDPEVVELGILYLRICCFVNFMPYVAMYILDSFAIGVGSPIFATANSLFQSVVIRLGLSFYLGLCMDNGFVALCMAESVSPLIPCLIGMAYFRQGGWRRCRQG